MLLRIVAAEINRMLVVDVVDVSEDVKKLLMSFRACVEKYESEVSRCSVYHDQKLTVGLPKMWQFP